MPSDEINRCAERGFNAKIFGLIIMLGGVFYVQLSEAALNDTRYRHAMRTMPRVGIHHHQAVACWPIATCHEIITPRTSSPAGE